MIFVRRSLLKLNKGGKSDFNPSSAVLKYQVERRLRSLAVISSFWNETLHSCISLSHMPEFLCVQTLVYSVTIMSFLKQWKYLTSKTKQINYCQKGLNKSYPRMQFYRICLTVSKSISFQCLGQFYHTSYHIHTFTE